MTCNRNSLEILLFKTASGEQSFAYRAVKIRNDLDSLNTDVVLFFFLFFLKTLPSEVSVCENKRGVQERKIKTIYFLLPPPLPLAVYILSRALDGTRGNKGNRR